ncbi:MAG TPA: hypothetical protein VM821_05180, partial [Abditibacteriaceae bacterium]|nr:hypothetical protein [Abditibacteriaceae bacterium]
MFSANSNQRHRAKHLLLLGLLISSHLEAIPVGAQAIDARAARVITQMANAESNANYTAVQTIARRNSTPIRVRIWRLGRKRRLEYLAPNLNRGDVLVDDGRNTWLYHRAENAAVQTRSPAPRYGNIVGRASRAR